MSEEEAQKARYQLLEEGTYKGAIEVVETKPSSSGNPMLVIHLRTWNREGAPKEITDWIPLIPSMIWKLRHLCESAGLLKEFEDKSFKPDMLLNRDAMMKIKCKAASPIPDNKLNGKPPGSMYPANNAVEDYLPIAKNSGMKPLPEVKDDFNDELPF
ncbi:MAG TPA: hypothetical protein VKG26_09485 [Bacteroidia bacterium]|nr:hypothetical protein [Bacteroidia bacterium]